MKKTLAIAVFAAFSFAASAQAMPVAPMQAQGMQEGMIEHVAQGCGPGMSRNSAGRCRPAYMNRGCRPGWHKNRFGVCRPNR
jgi:hypothetical protein